MSDVQPIASVVTVTYNHEPFIGRTLEGIVRQKTKFPFELLVCDDCSPDGTRAVVDQYWRKYPHIIKPLHNATNLRKGNSQRLSRVARGRFLAYCEGDDEWHDETKLQKQVDILVSDPAVSLVHTHSHALYVASNRLVRNAHTVPRDLRDDEGYFDLLTGRRTIWTLTVCVRREVQDRVLEECAECSDPRWKMVDTQKWLELLRRGGAKCVHEALTTRNFLVESATRSTNPEKVLSFRLNGKALIEHYLNKYPCPENVAITAKANHLYIVMEAAYRARNLAVAEELAKQASVERIPVPTGFYTYLVALRKPLLYPLVERWVKLGSGCHQLRRHLRRVLNPSM